MVSLSDYIEFAEHMYYITQGDVLSRLLSLYDDHVLNENLWCIDIAAGVSGKCIAPLDDVLVSHLLSVKALHMQNYVEAFNHQCVHVGAVVRLLQTQTGTNWMLPVMYTATTDLRLVANTAEQNSSSNGSLLEQAAETLMLCVVLCFEDKTYPPKNNKIVGLLNPINNILRIYFKLSLYPYCKGIIKMVEQEVIRGSYAPQEVITFRFFVGRMAMVDGDFLNAHRHLYFAFKKSHPECYKNKRIILTYLLPVRMLLGYLPARNIMEKYNLVVFWHMVIAVREGQIKEFEDLLLRNHRFFASAGLLGTLDHLRLVTYRNVFKNVHQSANTQCVPLSSLQAGLQLMAQTDVDIPETRALVATMIYNNKIRGYYSYNSNTVVFHPYDAFPRLATLCYPAFY